MSTKRRSLSPSIEAVVVMFFVAAGLAHADPPTWTPETSACAQTIGISPGYDFDPTAENQFRQLAWLSDAVIVGTVQEVLEELTADYPTTVVVRPTRALKGSVRDIVVLKLSSGRVVAGKEIIHLRKVGESATYSKGEVVLLFLTKAHARVDTDRPASFGTCRGSSPKSPLP